MADKYLDCTLLKCPMPVVKVSRAVKEMDCGQTLCVTADDPAFGSDIQAWVQMTGHELLEFSDGPTQQVVIKKV